MKILGHDLSDLLMYSQDAYYRQVEFLNSETWLLQLALVAILFLAIAISFKQKVFYARGVVIILAASWLSSAYFFHFNIYSQINWLAYFYSAFFIIQALILLWASRRLAWTLPVPKLLYLSAGTVLIMYAVFIHPILTSVKNGFESIELVGLHPTPLIVATFGSVLLISQYSRGLLLIPVIYAIVESTLSWELGIYENFITIAASFPVFFTLLWRKYERVSTRKL